MGLLYAGIWVALVGATVDASPEVAATARALVNRLVWRLVQTASLGAASSARRPSPDSPAVDLLDAWRRAPGPSLASLGLLSPHYAQCAAQFSLPTLGSQPSHAVLDPLSIVSLERAARKRALFNALLEGTALAAAAYDDTTLRAVLEASGGVGDALRSTAKWLVLIPHGTVDSIARKVLAAARGRAFLTAAAAASAASHTTGHAAFGSPVEPPQPHFGVWSTPGLYGMLHSVGSSLGVPFDGVFPLALAEQRVAQGAGGADVGRPVLSYASPLMGGGGGHEVAWTSSPRHEFIRQDLELSTTRHDAAATPWFGSNTSQAGQARAMLTVGRGGGVGDVTMSPVTLPPAATALELLPALSLGAAAETGASLRRAAPLPLPPPPSVAGSSSVRGSHAASDESGPADSSVEPMASPPSVKRRGSTRPPTNPLSGGSHSSSLAQRRGSRLASDYDVRAGGGGRDARLSAALLSATDVAALQLLATSMASDAGVANASPSVAGSFRLLGTIAEVAEVGAPERPVSTGVGAAAADGNALAWHLGSDAEEEQKMEMHAVAPQPPQLTSAASLGGVPVAAASEFSSAAHVGHGLRAALAIDTGLTIDTSPAAPVSATAQSEFHLRQQQFAETLYAAAALAHRAAGGSQEALNMQVPLTVTETEIDQSLRSLASVTPRLAPSLLARTPAAAVRSARSAARKLVQVWRTPPRCSDYSPPCDASSLSFVRRDASSTRERR